ncbi:MAG: YeeE/YedE family protein, partial [Rhodobacterales bacterium]|nr:YeeE/YedE family protein [Rhodobacterales bacterium]
TLFWSLASTAVSAKFGTGLITGVILSAFLSSLQSKRFEIKSFETPIQTTQYITGAMLMGFGGVLAGGCTMGAGISGISTLSVSAFLAIICIVLGAKIANRQPRLLERFSF